MKKWTDFQNLIHQIGLDLVEVVRDDGVLQQKLERHDAERVFVRRFQHHGACSAGHLDL